MPLALKRRLVFLRLACLLSAFCSWSSNASEPTERRRPWYRWSGSPARHCGITEIFDADGRVLRGLQHSPVCRSLMSTNCSRSLATIRCPRDCAYLAPSRSFPCSFRCVPADECGLVNPELAFPDPATHTCARCGVQSCRRCEAPGRCGECHDGFKLRGEAADRCSFVLDPEWAEDLSQLTWLLALSVLALVCLGIAWLCLYGLHPNRDANLASISHAIANRHRVKVQDWNHVGRGRFRQTLTRGVTKLRRWYPLTTNMHTSDILGVGLSLFYNSICFIAIIALLFFGVTWIVYSSSHVHLGLSTVDAYEEEGNSNGATQLRSTKSSMLESCGGRLSGNVHDALKSYALNMFWAVGFLYVATFVLSLVYAKFQKNYAKSHDEKHVNMSDLAICVKGLPPQETDEAKLHAWLSSVMVSPDGDATLDKSNVEVLGVSICYDYTHCQEVVEKATWDLHEKWGLRRPDRAYTGEIESDEHTASATIHNMQSMCELESTPFLDSGGESRRTVEALFDDGPSKLKGCGSAFVVFRRPVDVRRVWDLYANDPDFLRHPAAPDRPLYMRQVLYEPPTVRWEHMGISKTVRHARFLQALLKIFLLVGALHVFVMRAFLNVVVLPYAKTGAEASGNKMVIAGMILGNINNLLCMTIYSTCSGMGFHERDKMDAAIFCANIFLCVLNTSFNLYSMSVMVLSRESAHLGIGVFFSMDSLVAINAEHAMAGHLYSMMVPGMTVIGYLMFPIMAGVVPYCVNLLLMHLIYVWGCLPGFLLELIKKFLPWAPDSLESYSARHAEKGLEPMEIGLAWDYSSNILLPSMCFCMLFFVSPFVWKIFLALFGWACFYYCWCRYVHLRFMKTCFYSTNRLDVWVNYAWGLPLSIVAAAWCVWGFRAAGEDSRVADLSVTTHLALVVAAFAASWALWIVCYCRLVKPLETEAAEEDEDALTFEDVAADRLYTWFNCNPVYVLKCAYYFRDADGQEIPGRRGGHPLASGADEREVRAYEIGKEIQLLDLDERRRLTAAEDASAFTDALGSPLEFETLLERFAAVLRRRWRRWRGGAARGAGR